MGRLSDRIGAAARTATCPACGHRVIPVEGSAGESSAAEEPPGKRWSFIWVPQRGDFCPDCQFPLSRYAGRAKWIRLLLTGIALLSLALLGLILHALGSGQADLGLVARILGVVGLGAVMLGVSGIIIGGYHGPGRVGQRVPNRSPDLTGGETE